LKNDHYDYLTRPVCAFITFEEEEGYQTACRMGKKRGLLGAKISHKYIVLGDKFEIEPATEPTNIIWENRHITTGQMVRRSIVSGIIILVLLLCSFIIIFMAKRVSIKANQVYPNVDCA